VSGLVHPSQCSRPSPARRRRGRSGSHSVRAADTPAGVTRSDDDLDDLEPDGAGAPWYVGAFDEGYLARYAHRDRAEAARQVELLHRVGLVAPGRLVLDLCCGAGRHAEPARDLGARIVGLDLSAPLLREARRRLPV